MEWQNVEVDIGQTDRAQHALDVGGVNILRCPGVLEEVILVDDTTSIAEGLDDEATDAHRPRGPIGEGSSPTRPPSMSRSFSVACPPSRSASSYWRCHCSLPRPAAM